MQATFDQIEDLFALQKYTLACSKAERELQELPQREEILRLRTKRTEIQKKQEQITALLKQAEHEIVHLTTDDEHQAVRQAETQKAIEEHAGNYREVTNRSKELETIRKKRASLSERMDAATEKLEKIQALAAQVDNALAQIDAAEAAAIESFKADGTELTNTIAAAKVEIANLRDALPAELLKAFDAAALRGAGVAIGQLSEGRCSCCRHKLADARLIQVKKDAPISECPNCKRMMLV